MNEGENQIDQQNNNKTTYTTSTIKLLSPKSGSVNKPRTARWSLHKEKSNASRIRSKVKNTLGS